MKEIVDFFEGLSAQERKYYGARRSYSEAYLCETIIANKITCVVEVGSFRGMSAWA